LARREKLMWVAEVVGSDRDTPGSMLDWVNSCENDSATAAGCICKGTSTVLASSSVHRLPACVLTGVRRAADRVGDPSRSLYAQQVRTQRIFGTNEPLR